MKQKGNKTDLKRTVLNSNHRLQVVPVKPLSQSLEPRYAFTWRSSEK